MEESKGTVAAEKHLENLAQFASLLSLKINLTLNNEDPDISKEVMQQLLMHGTASYYLLRRHDPQKKIMLCRLDPHFENERELLEEYECMPECFKSDFSCEIDGQKIGPFGYTPGELGLIMQYLSIA